MLFVLEVTEPDSQEHQGAQRVIADINVLELKFGDHLRKRASPVALVDLRPETAANMFAGFSASTPELADGP